MAKLTILINSFIIPKQLALTKPDEEKVFIKLPTYCYTNHQAEQINHWLNCFRIILHNMSDAKFSLLQRSFSRNITSPCNKYTIFNFVQRLLDEPVDFKSRDLIKPRKRNFYD